MLRKRQNSMTPGQLAGRAGLGFTLMEMMVAVGAVALVAVGLAAIFDSVGKTVTGGRRVSVVNTYSSLIESQLRRDFDNMSRDGFLIIRNQWVDTVPDGIFDPLADTVLVSEDQPANRARGHRIDELQFVATGKFRSSRQALRPDVQAESNVAVVYYGHGLMAPASGTIDNEGYKKSKPRPDDRNGAAMGFGVASLTGQDNPNQYCGNWMLLRHVTLLTNADAALSPPVTPGVSVYGHANYQELRNRPTQFMLQPAASSIFRTVASFYPELGPATTPTPDSTLRRVTLADGDYPGRASGIVDIASSSLADIRAVVNTCPDAPFAMTGTWPGAWPLIPNRTMTPTPANAGRDPSPANYTDIDRMQALMSDLMPTESRNQATATTIHHDFPARSGAAWGARIRYEDGPTDLLPAMATAGTSPAQQLTQAQRRADQLMLSSSNFVPHCTDFHVEWSFGMVDSYGQTVWHGLPTPRTYYRLTPTQAMRAEEPRPYPFTSPNTSDGAQHPYIFNIGTGTATHTVTQRLIYGVVPAVDDAELTSYFGWIDPTYAPAGAVPIDALSTGIVPWAWPKMVRVTVTLVDPIDPTIESTFQYIFDVPEKQGPRAQ